MIETIKCPFCTLDEEFNRAQLHNHLIAEGDYAGIWLADLVFKIHEKIESFTRQEENYTFRPVCGITEVIQELKSLLNGDLRK